MPINSLHDIGKKLLKVKDQRDLTNTVANEISGYFKADALVQLYGTSGEVLFRNVAGQDVFKEKTEMIATLEAYQSGSPCGCGTTLFANANAYYMPIFGSSGVMGMIGVSLPNTLTLTSGQRAFLDAMVPQIAVVIERERLYEIQKESQLEIQRERMRVDMLRSISHDLRTPLAGIMGLASSVLENFDKVNDDVKKIFLKNIYDDADWLNGLVENILQTTRFDEGNVKLNLEQEAAEEIVTEAVIHIKNRAPGHKIMVKIPEEIILLRVDGGLIRQVLINLLNNAVQFCPEGCEIIVLLHRVHHRVVFEIIDNGPGISEIDLPHIFERYYHRKDRQKTNRKGMGLGLSLCKSIVEAHGGVISVRNNEPHGTIASFSIISGEEQKDRGAADFDC